MPVDDGWSDETRPHGVPHPTEPGQRWDNELRAWTNDGSATPVPEMPTRDQISAVELRLAEAIGAGMRDPFVHGIDDAARGVLVGLAFHALDEFGLVGDRLIARMRGVDANGDAAYTQVERSEFRTSWNRSSTQAYHIRRTREAEATAQRSLMRVAGGTRASTPRRGRERQEREAVDGAEMSASELIASDAMLLKAMGYLLRHREGRVWFDSFRQVVRTNWSGGNDVVEVPEETVEDPKMLAIYVWLLGQTDDLSGLSLETAGRAVEAMARRDVHNPVTAWLDGLQWDGVQRVARLFPDYLGTRDSIYHHDVGRVLLVSMVARAYSPGEKVDTMPVLVGAQGALKSTAIEVLGGGKTREGGFTRTLSDDITNKDFKLGLRGVWLGEVAELASLLGRRSSAEHIKNAISTAEDYLRAPYGKGHQTYPRTCVLFGSTNERYTASDATGMRRYLYAEVVGDIRIEALRRDREQLFAEAVSMYREGLASLAAGTGHVPNWWEFEREEHASLVEAATEENPLKARIASRIDQAMEDRAIYLGEDGGVALRFGAGRGTTDSEVFGTALTTYRIGVQFLGLPVDRLTTGSKEVKTIADAMRKLGWESVLMRASRGVDHLDDPRERIRVWLRKDRPNTIL